MPLFNITKPTISLFEKARQALSPDDLDTTMKNSTRRMLTHLLCDAEQHFIPVPQKQRSKWSPAKKMLRRFGFFCVVLAGTIGVVCEAMDGVSSIVGLIGLDPLTVLIIAASIMLLAIALFVINSLPDLAKMLRLDVQFSANLDEEQYTLQKQFGSLLDTITENKALNDTQWRAFMTSVHARIGQLQNELEHHTPRWWHRIIANAFPAIAVLISFCGGFCAGQTLALLVGGFFAASLTPLHLPILLACVFAGLVTSLAFGLSQYANIRAQIMRSFGFDEEKHDALAVKRNKHNVRWDTSLYLFSVPAVERPSSSSAPDVQEPPSNDVSPESDPASAGVFQP